MTYYFIGGEDHDFTRIGATGVDTATTAARRTANARCSLRVGTSAATSDGWQGAFSASTAACWITARFYLTQAAFANTEFFSLMDGSIRRITLRVSSGGVYQLIKRNTAGTVITLVTSSVAPSLTNLQKLDVQVNYGTTGSINIYIGNALVISYSGDVTTDTSTSLSGFILGTHTSSASGGTYWSEVICTSEDTRSLSLVTMAPAANGNAFAWTNSYTNINEVTTDDVTLCTSSSADQLAQVTVSSAGITGNPAIRGVCISARAQKGGTGPQNLQMNVRTGGNDYFGATQALPAALGRVATVFETNPGTAGPFAFSDLTAAGFNVGVKSVA